MFNEICALFWYYGSKGKLQKVKVSDVREVVPHALSAGDANDNDLCRCRHCLGSGNIRQHEGPTSAGGRQVAER